MSDADRADAQPTGFARDAAAPPPSATETATFGLGCFWGPDARFGAMAGVVRTRVGYAGGTTPEPTYHSLGDHTEVVQVEYDPTVLSYADLLDVFWSAHDPRQSARKRQYRSVILTESVVHRQAAERTRQDTASRLGGSVATAIEDLDAFHLAEPYHQKYELRLRGSTASWLATATPSAVGRCSPTWISRPPSSTRPADGSEHRPVTGVAAASHGRGYRPLPF